MKNYYFTFGKLKTHPFYGGWIIVKARNLRSAIDLRCIFRTEKILCFAIVRLYTQKRILKILRCTYPVISEKDVMGS